MSQSHGLRALRVLLCETVGGVDGDAVARGDGEVRVVPAFPVAFRAWRGNMPLCMRQRSVCGADLAEQGAARINIGYLTCK
jgi:hypothetical protein